MADYGEERTNPRPALPRSSYVWFLWQRKEQIAKKRTNPGLICSWGQDRGKLMCELLLTAMVRRYKSEIRVRRGRGTPSDLVWKSFGKKHTVKSRGCIVYRNSCQGLWSRSPHGSFPTRKSLSIKGRSSCFQNTRCFILFLWMSPISVQCTIQIRYSAYDGSSGFLGRNSTAEVKARHICSITLPHCKHSIDGLHNL